MQESIDLEVVQTRTLMEAIVSKKRVTATYNGGEMALAPHQLFERHGELFVSALNINKNWREDEEKRLGHFKLKGLSDITLTEEMFEPLPNFDGVPPQPTDKPVFSVDMS